MQLWTPGRGARPGQRRQPRVHRRLQRARRIPRRRGGAPGSARLRPWRSAGRAPWRWPFSGRAGSRNCRTARRLDGEGAVVNEGPWQEPTKLATRCRAQRPSWCWSIRNWARISARRRAPWPISGSTICALSTRATAGPTRRRFTTSSGAHWILESAKIFDDLARSAQGHELRLCDHCPAARHDQGGADPRAGRPRHARAASARARSSPSCSAASAGASTMTKSPLPMSSSPRPSIPPSPRSTSPRPCCSSAMNGIKDQAANLGPADAGAGRPRRPGPADARHAARHQGGALRLLRASRDASSMRPASTRPPKKSPAWCATCAICFRAPSLPSRRCARLRGMVASLTRAHLRKREKSGE